MTAENSATKALHDDDGARMTTASALRAAMLGMHLKHRLLTLHEVERCFTEALGRPPAGCPWRGALDKAVEHEIVSELRRLGRSTPPSHLIPKLAARLSRYSGIDYPSAHWATESWAMALDILVTAPGDERIVVSPTDQHTFRRN